MVVVLKPLHDAAKIKRVVVSTYQAVSEPARKPYMNWNNRYLPSITIERVENKVYPWQIAFNILPHIDSFLESGYTKEEMKMVNETKKIMEDDIKVTATTVRVPSFTDIQSQSI